MKTAEHNEQVCVLCRSQTQVTLEQRDFSRRPRWLTVMSVIVGIVPFMGGLVLHMFHEAYSISHTLLIPVCRTCAFLPRVENYCAGAFFALMMGGFISLFIKPSAVTIGLFVMAGLLLVAAILVRRQMQPVFTIFTADFVEVRVPDGSRYVAYDRSRSRRSSVGFEQFLDAETEFPQVAATADNEDPFAVFRQ